MTRLGRKIRDWARALKRETAVLWFAIRDPETPWYARALGILVVGYAISPIDLIPDFIPVLGYLDDLILLPLGLSLLRRLIPETIMERARQRADLLEGKRVTSRLAGAIVIGVWILAAGLVALALLRPFGR
jgi:uncharacterized membrane protein YkvA (DUF1232 family)